MQDILVTCARRPLSHEMVNTFQTLLRQKAFKLETWFVEFGTKAHHSLV